eukprot:TRINITY_DN24818_c0_g1_i1.p1 TRINITY_DN24818_c0_g1~~TRINITY_DN24818_c0_g1_i1.p1  ORF type:complete len:331 (-),score=-11.74 TRINITY_DN24818_c0_g1_i1:261-1253(-)
MATARCVTPFLLVALLASAAATTRATAASSPGGAEPKTKASDYPLCWFSGLPPTRPNVTVTRCLDAQEWTCCSDCDDRRYALVEKSTDGKVVLNQVYPGLGMKFEKTNMMMCAQFSGFTSCQFYLEQIACATGCNPDAGDYFTMAPGQPRVMSVCNDFAQRVYKDCEGLSLPGVATLDRFFPTAQRFMEDLFGKIGSAFGVNNYTVKVVPGPDKCYNGPKNLPKLPVCCDPLPVPNNCPAHVMNFTEFPDMKRYINSTSNDPDCIKMVGGDLSGSISDGSIPIGDNSGSSSSSYSSSGTSQDASAKNCERTGAVVAAMVPLLLVVVGLMM